VTGCREKFSLNLALFAAGRHPYLVRCVATARFRRRVFYTRALYGGEISDLGMQGLKIELHRGSPADVIGRRPFSTAAGQDMSGTDGLNDGAGYIVDISLGEVGAPSQPHGSDQVEVADGKDADVRRRKT
jgi:hypothetical protein